MTWEDAPTISVPCFVASRLAALGHAPALRFDDGVEISGRELLAKVQRFAGFLQSSVARGARVTIAVGNRVEHVVAHLAATAVSAVPVPIDPHGDFDAMRDVVRATGSVMAVAEGCAIETLRAVQVVCPELAEIVGVHAAEPHGLNHLGDAREVRLADHQAVRDEVAEIRLTAGTTGAPKAVQRSHRDVLRDVAALMRVHPLKAGDRLLSPLPLHVADAAWALNAALAAGTPLGLMRSFDASRFWTVAARLNATHVVLTSAASRLLLVAEHGADDRAHAVRHAFTIGIPTGGEALDTRFGARWINLYSSAETGLALAMPDGIAERYAGTGALGLPLPDVDVRLVTEFGQVIEGPGEGQLEIRGASSFAGYVSGLAPGPVDGWVRTGDLARRDDGGVYSFLGRHKETIRRGRQVITASEVEEVLRDHPAVFDAAVVPVADERRGEELKAYIQLRDGWCSEPRAIAAFAGSRLDRPKVPRYIEFRSDLPRTPNGWIRKGRLKVEGTHQVLDAWDRGTA